MFDTPDKMIDQVFIETMIMPGIIKAVREFDGPATKDKKKRPEFYPGYNQVCDIHEELMVHTHVKCFPEKLLSQRSPNMTDKEFEYVKNNYQPITVPVWIDFINSVSKCWNDSGWNIVWPEETKFKEEDSLRNYLENDFSMFGSIEAYFKQFQTAVDLQDANGALAIKPKLLFDKEIGFYEDDTEMREPEPVYYNCCQVINPFCDDYFIVMSSEKSDCKKGNTKSKCGYIFEIYTKESIFIVFQVDNFKDFTFETMLYMRHDMGVLPIKRNGGVPIMICDKMHYLSVFQFAVGNLNLALLNASNLQLSINNVVYPIRAMIANECDFEDKTQPGRRCVDGIVKDMDGTNPVKCSACQGSGLKSRLSPMGTLLIKPKGSFDEGEIKPSDAIYYVSPDTASLQFLVDKITSDENRARSILHLKSQQQQGTGENVVESESNAQAHYSFIKPISDQIFNQFQWTIDITGKYREGTEYSPVKVVAPINFEFYTEQDYLNQIKDAIQAQLPPFVIYTIVYKFLQTMFYTEQETAKRFYLITAADKLLTLSDNAIQQGLARGSIVNWQVILHQSGVNLIGEIERSGVDLWSMELQDQVELLEQAAKDTEAELQQPDENQQMVDNTLNQLTTPPAE